MIHHKSMKNLTNLEQSIGHRNSVTGIFSNTNSFFSVFFFTAKMKANTNQDTNYDTENDKNAK